MMTKDSVFTAKPAKKESVSSAKSISIENVDTNEWAKTIEKNLAKKQKVQRIYRLTMEISPSLHARIKAHCAAGNKKIKEEVTEILEAHYAKNRQVKFD